MVKKAIKASTFGLIDLDKKEEDLPTEDASVLAFRERQVRDLAELDEEENRRIKTALFPRVRAFRRKSGDSPGSSVRSTSGRAGQIASSRAFKGNQR